MIFLRRRGVYLVAMCLFFSGTLTAQTLDWWTANVGWDGVTSWKRYLIFSPGFMGPNALPVPEIGNGSIDSVSTIGMTADFHFRKGDPTQNIKLIGNYCIAKNLISADISYIPMEWFQTSHLVKQERHVYYKSYYDNHQSGDVYMNLNLQLLNKFRKYIHLAARIGYRFPTGTLTGAARYTDSPGYYFDLSCGKKLGATGALKLLGMVGFYVWQTNRDDHFQDDAYLFGLGLEYNKNSWRLQANSCAYFGYMKDGDDPIVIRIAAEKRIKNVTALLRCQKGVQDFKYTTLEAGAKFRIGKD